MEATKRPWRVDSSKPTSHYPLRILGDGEIAGVCYRGDLAQGTYAANARLIVTAVNLFEEMVAGLIMAQANLDKRSMTRQKWTNQDQRTFETIDALLKRAKGE